MEYFSCFSPQAAAGSWYLPNEFVTRTKRGFQCCYTEQDKDTHPVFSQMNPLLTSFISLYLKEKQFHTQAPAVSISLALFLTGRPVPVK